MKYLILGAGKTSFACLNALAKKKKKVSICINKNEIYKLKDYFLLIDNVFYMDEYDKIDFSNFDYIIRSPGINALTPIIKYLKDNNYSLINEIELAYLLTNKKGYYIGITGSNGKTTTASLLYECIRKQTSNVILAGNIGTPLVSLINKINNYTFIIVEMSSFQLEDMHELHFDIACLLNLSINHMDNVPSLDFYYKSKFNIANLQDNTNYFIANLNDEKIVNYLKNIEVHSKIIDYTDIVLETNNFALKGSHNIENIKAVVCILKIIQFDIDYETIESFKTLKYHLEEIYTKSGYLVVNDSKSTTVDSLKVAIDTYKDKSIVLIFGGKNKGGDFSFLNDVHIKRKICYGKLSNEISDIYLDYKSYSLDDCINYAFSIANKEDVILFSCGCASFDLFSSYIERGEYFNKLVISK